MKIDLHIKLCAAIRPSENDVYCQSPASSQLWIEFGFTAGK